MDVNVKLLMDSLNEVESFSLPWMGEGLRYLYDNVYKRLLCGDDVLLSEISFNSFDLDDIESLRDLHSGTLETNGRKIESLVGVLCDIQPIAVPVEFV